jgi:hypothetical protein
MGASFSPAFLPGYLAAARAARVPAFMPRMGAEALLTRGMREDQVDGLLAFQRQLEESGQPLVDHIGFMPLDRHEERVATAKAVFDALPAGLSYLILHPAQDTPELRTLTPVDWPARVADYQAFTSAELCDHVRSSDVHVIGWRVIRDAMRANLAG